MALYYFHLREGIDILLDPEGQEFGTPGLAWDCALREARAIIGDEARSGRILLDRHIDVVDAGGTTIHRLPFCDAVEIVAAA